MSPRNSVFGKRKTGARTEKKVLIVCEGEKTEPQYFVAFDVNKELIDVQVIGAGKNTDSLVEHALALKVKADKCHKPYSHVWCVFDRDSFTAGQFNRAMDIAKSKNIEVAYSNEAFELWYILHFEYLQSGLSRKAYKDKLTKALKKLTGDPNKKYKKNDVNMYEMLKDKQETAIKWAQKLLDDQWGADHNPEKDNPSTTVHKFVKFLIDYT